MAKNAGRSSQSRAEGLTKVDAVTRRQFLGWMGAGAAAIAASSLLTSCASSTQNSAVGDIVVTPPENKDLQFALPALPSTVTGLVLSVQGRKYPLQEHTVASRQALQGTHPLGRSLDVSKLTHYVQNVSMPTHMPLEFMVWGTDSMAASKGIPVASQVTWQSSTEGVGLDANAAVSGQAPGSVYIAGGMNIPTQALRTALTAAGSVKSIKEVFANDARLAPLGLSAPPSTVAEAISLFDLHDVATSTAAKIVYKAPGVTNLSATGSAIVMSIINSNQRLSGLAGVLTQFFNKYGVYGATEAQVANPDNDPIYISNTPSQSGSGPQAMNFAPFIDQGTSYAGIAIPDQMTTNLRNAMGAAAQSVSNQCQDTIDLQQTPDGIAQGNSGNWVVGPGATPQVIPAATAAKLAGEHAAKYGDNPTVNWVINPSGFHNNFEVVLHGDPRPATPAASSGSANPSDDPTPGGDGTVVTVRVYNNNERFCGVYMQQWNGNKQLPAVPDFQTPVSTDDQTILVTQLGSVDVVMGVPITGQNWQDVDIVIQAQATQVTILLGSFGAGTGWKPLFKDLQGNQLYSGCASPGMAKTATIWTAVMNIGVPFIMLATDVIGFSALLSTAAAMVNTTATDSMIALLKSFAASQTIGPAANAILGSPLVNNGNAVSYASGSIAGIITPIAKCVVGLLTSPFAIKLWTKLLALEGAARIADAIPLVGEAFAIAATVADAAMLATGVAEVTSNPWVTPFGLSGSYTAPITINKDPSNGVFPRTAVKWVLQGQIEGGDALPVVEDDSFSWQTAPKDGSIIQNVPVVPVGNRIRWQIVFTDQYGHKVGVGATDWLDNSNIDALPTPTITITELQPPVDATTTYDLNATTAWDSQQNAFVYSQQTTIGGTIQDQTTGTGNTALTAAGSITTGAVTDRVGMVYKTEAGWMVAQVGSGAQSPNDGAMQLGKVYDAQPHLVFDGTGGQLTGGHNYLLEPNSDVGYIVRQLDLSQPGYGLADFGSEPITSHGRFTGELHGVTFHPAGYILGYNSTTGRMQSLRLPANPYPLDAAPAAEQWIDLPTANMFAGTGNATGQRPGLLQQPVGITTGLNGIVLVLEQGAKRIQAFNTAGAPTQYFTPNGSDPSYYLDLSEHLGDTTFLGFGVDGTGYIFVHGYNGDGSSPDQYGISVYNTVGENVVPFANNINAAGMTVDYWRDVFTQDFVPVQQSSGGAYIGPNGYAQPAVSIWIPNTPGNASPAPTGADGR